MSSENINKKLDRLIEENDYYGVKNILQKHPEYKNYILGEAAARAKRDLINLALNYGADDILYGIEEASLNCRVAVVKHLKNIAFDYGIKVTEDFLKDIVKNLVYCALNHNRKDLITEITNNAKQLGVTGAYISSLVDQYYKEELENNYSYSSEEEPYEKKYADYESSSDSD